MITQAYAAARRDGVAVEFADLGQWGPHELRSEYDPSGPVIRINVRLLQRLPPRERPGRIALAIAHELYHHREYCGRTPRIADAGRREEAADAFAREMLA
ncbi:MAG TPA: hypothetical protein VFE17_09660 [Candidatus Baltobacteraceae bacterium]|nr:hypothetical protein [Candidatus Baltobacteraceae bacterium]